MNSEKLITSRHGTLAPNMLSAPVAAKRLTFTANTTYRYRGEVPRPVYLVCEPWPPGLSPIWCSERCNAD